MWAEHTAIDAKAAPVVAGTGRSRIATVRLAPRSSCVTRSGHGAPEGTTARATTPEGAVLVGAASVYAEMTSVRALEAAAGTAKAATRAIAAADAAVRLFTVAR